MSLRRASRNAPSKRAALARFDPPLFRHPGWLFNHKGMGLFLASRARGPNATKEDCHGARFARGLDMVDQPARKLSSGGEKKRPVMRVQKTVKVRKKRKVSIKG